MKLEVVSDISPLLDLQPEWTSFADTVTGLTAFQTPEWLLTWWRHFGSGSLQVFTFRNDQELVGIVPCFLHEWNGARQLTLIGSGISDYLEPPIKAAHATEIVNQLQAHLAASHHWDLCDWQDLSFHTPWRGLATESLDETPCMAIPITGSFEDYWSRCAGSLRNNVRRDRGKAEAHGSLEFAVSQKARPELLDALIEMHAARWREQDQPGMIEANRSAEFLRNVAEAFASRDRLRIFSLSYNEKLVAIILGFAYRNRLSNYLTGFDPEYQRLGFGRTLLYESIRYSFEMGFDAWDFLRGNEQYKSWWRAQTIPKARLLFRSKA